MFERNKAGQPEPETTQVKDMQESPKSTTSIPSSTSMSRSTAVIGATVHIKGDITSEENLIIEGQVDGTISLKGHELIIGQSGKANANITAKVIKVDGQVEGDLVGKEKIVISKTGNAKGNIVAPTVILEEGGKFKGSIDMGHDAGSSMADKSFSKPSRVMPETSANETSPAKQA